ncbi:L,D-transpeptidase family protein [Streptomyces sp. WAC 00631]|uniref:L,D-transpeptidase family protein n=1 Tax=Streptomyces sp. WAC 00631 TaxID=2203201 RepID=UPI000F79088E|nr:L,D-transpeptidase family protein [Streptomyces sp. WAC 00631]MCC5036773.1 L,D-transpeptidase family protein [Streptomyces sp. WAC 00631]
MRITGTQRTTAAALTAAALLTGCGAAGGGAPRADGERPARGASPAADPTRLPGVGDRLHARVPESSRQAVVVYGEGRDSADAEAVLYTRKGETWDRTRAWPAHNGKRGWTPDHRAGDKRSPSGVFTLSDAGGVLADPGAKLPYTRSAAFAAPRSWAKTHWHDFDYVIAIDYNRVKGTPPNDPNRPRGDDKGGYIWLHLDHGSGTSGCVSLPKTGMEYLLRTLDPEADPVVVMGEKNYLKG